MCKIPFYTLNIDGYLFKKNLEQTEEARKTKFEGNKAHATNNQDRCLAETEKTRNKTTKSVM